ncbi:MAG: flippase-like domain-containing protein [Candidatus Melainabacteria bacterium]|nr:flippase-like domain-containing protein [Candidatus Melainabacteria bacterium]
MRKKIFFLLKLILVITIFYWIIKSVNLTETYNTLLKANLILVVIAFLMNNLSNIFLTIKWYRLSKPLKLKSSFMELLKLNYISVFYSSFLPGQTSGELVKGAKLTKTEGAVQKVWIPIFIDKATNLLITFLIGFVAIIMDENLRNNNYLLFSVSIATLLFTFITMILFSEHTEKAIRFLKDKLVQVMDIFKIEKDSLGNWGQPVNLGSPINTIAGDEKSPFIHTDNQTLYFSSITSYFLRFRSKRRGGHYYTF